MKKVQVIGIALIAVFAVSLSVTALASAAPTTLLALWLFNNVTFEGAKASTTTGSLELSDTVAGVKVTSLCTGLLDGTVSGANGEDNIAELLTSAGGLVSKTILSGTQLACTNVSNCGANAEAVAVNLPWNTLAALLEGVTGAPFFVDLLVPDGAGNPGWAVTCLSVPILGEVEDTCTTPVGISKLTNEATGVLGAFEEAFTVLAGLKLALCSESGSESGEVNGSGLITLNAGGTLSVSSE